MGLLADSLTKAWVMLDRLGDELRWLRLWAVRPLKILPLNKCVLSKNDVCRCRWIILECLAIMAVRHRTGACVHSLLMRRGVLLAAAE